MTLLFAGSRRIRAEPGGTNRHRNVVRMSAYRSRLESVRVVTNGRVMGAKPRALMSSLGNRQACGRFGVFQHRAGAQVECHSPLPVQV